MFMKIGKQKSLNLSCKKFTFCKLLIYALLLFLGTISVNSYAQNKNVPKTSPRIKEKENCSYRIIKNTSGAKLSSNVLEDIDAHRKFSENYL